MLCVLWREVPRAPDSPPSPAGADAGPGDPALLRHGVLSPRTPHAARPCPPGDKEGSRRARVWRSLSIASGQNLSPF